jgi:L-fuconolactonase
MDTARIDAHQHFWRYDPAEYGWIDDRMTALRSDFLPAQAKREMDAAHVDGCVAVQARHALDETRWLLDLAAAHPFILGVVGWIDLQADVAAQLEQFSMASKLVGVRHIVQTEPEDFLARPAFRRGVAQLTRFGLTYDILIYARQLASAVELARAFPHQRFVLDHLGKPDIKAGDFAGWRSDFERLAALPNVWCKLSGLVTEADWSTWTAAQLRPYIDVAFDAFGGDRLMIGSDWPVCTVAASYAEAVNVIVDALGGCSAAERARVLGGTAQQLWNLRPERVDRKGRL